jgi:hypothetical protein
MELFGELTPSQQTDALLWLAGYAPAVFDAVTDAVQPFTEDGSDDPRAVLRAMRCRHWRLPQVWPGLAAL